MLAAKASLACRVDAFSEDTTSSIEIGKIKGRQSGEIEKILGYVSKTEVVHKDDMVKL